LEASDDEKLECLKHKHNIELENARYNNDFTLELLKGLFMFSTGALKLLFTLTSGSAAALLVFMGHLAVSGQGAKIQGLSCGLSWFVFSAFLTVASIGFGWVSQYLYLKSSEKPMTGHVMLGVTIALAVLAYVFYIVGIFATYSALNRFQ
jgi:hypothetical protein